LWEPDNQNEIVMAKGLSAVLLAFIVLITFPLWIALMAGGFGVIVGIIAAIFGIFAGIFGAIIGVIGALLELIFGGIFNWDWHGPQIHFPHVHLNGFVIAAIIITLAIVFSKRRA